MENFSEFVSGIASKLAEGLKLKPTDKERLGQFKEKFTQDRDDNQDSLKALKDEIVEIEGRIKRKKAKYDDVHGLVKETIGQEIEQAFPELDRKEAQEKLILRNIEVTIVTLDKIRELEEAANRGVKESDLEGVNYKDLEKEPMDIDHRLGKLSGTKEPKKSETGLSAATMERLKPEEIIIATAILTLA